MKFGNTEFTIIEFITASAVCGSIMWLYMLVLGFSMSLAVPDIIVVNEVNKLYESEKMIFIEQPTFEWD